MKKQVLRICVLLLISLRAISAPVAVLFDVDGVLVDTEYLKFQAWQDALAKEKIAFSLDDYMPLVGMDSKKIAERIAADKNVVFDMQKVIAVKSAAYNVIQARGVEPIKPAVKFLNRLLENKKQLGIKVAVVSTPQHTEIIRNLKFAGVKYELLDGIFSGEDDLKNVTDPDGTNKPKPYIYQLATSRLQAEPSKTVVFEDTNAGVLAAADAGMVVIAMPNRFTDKQDFSRATAISNFKEFTQDRLNAAVR